MPYKQFMKGGRYCIKNLETGKVTCYASRQKRKTGIRLKHAFAHGWKPTGARFTTVRKHRRKGKQVRKHKRRIR